ncbi:type IV toxin-antitoxin system AbiEi family antitoxin domain-containing protein [Polaromonas sp. LjRoot131]|uniref:type IV toxin-antitoxin system AbiEi family antitoxin domain-containing protein n=1 Tax=Polaromonas sp. LjRoot131 TaxID=3342262 RepID=UPI003F4F7FB5
MKSTDQDFSFKKMLAVLPRAEPLDVADLKEKGLSPSHASHLAKAGWLTHLGRGVYMLPGDTLSRDGCLAYLMRRNAGLHVGAKTALAWRGVKHNIAFRETIALWGEQPMRLPAWLVSRFECSYQTTRLFGAGMPSGFGLQSLPGGHPSVLVSVPERAMLELLSDVGKTESLQDARQLAESARNLRASVLETLLTHTTRTKVVRLARALSEELDLPWAAIARKSSEAKGGGSRWIAVSRNGERLDLKP